MNSKLEISWNARKLSLLADRAIHLASENVLFIADPHFGKAATFRKSGIPVPEKSTQEDCDRLTHLINETKVETLGDSRRFFSRSFRQDRRGSPNPLRMERDIQRIKNSPYSWKSRYKIW